MNRPVVLMIVILLIIGAIAVNKIMTPSDTVQPQVSQQGTNINYPPPNNTTNTSNTSNGPSVPKQNVQQK